MTVYATYPSDVVIGLVMLADYRPLLVLERTDADQREHVMFYKEKHQMDGWIDICVRHSFRKKDKIWKCYRLPTRQ